VNGRYLLDTNVLIWTTSASGRLSHRAKRVLSAPAAPLLVSIISVWELVLKYQARKLSLRAGITEVLDKILYHSPWTILPMTPEHLPVLAGLPMLHGDPFDRMLIAQAVHEGLTIVTADEQIPKYRVKTLW
jgi:PIN domain nuclease of toxin-antitoxin system